MLALRRSKVAKGLMENKNNLQRMRSEWGTQTINEPSNRWGSKIKSICLSGNPHLWWNFKVKFPLGSTKITKKQIQQSSYEELISKITKLYSFNQYKIPSALALLQIHHQYSIFRPGDWVLDIGAGPLWAWTDLALKLTHNAQATNRVISNDLKECLVNKENNVKITGNFLQQPVRTKIAMNLLERQLNTIIIDATPQFTGDLERDSHYTMQIFIQALQFSQKYLKKGGTIIFKTIESRETLKNQVQAKIFFHEVYKHKSNSFRIDSPAIYFVMRGYLMTEDLQAIQNFFVEYDGGKNSYSKTRVVQKYRGKYNWDPVEILNNRAKQTIFSMKEAGKRNKQIASVYENDPYVRIRQILELFDKIEGKETNNIQKYNAKRELLYGEEKSEIYLPQNEQQFAQMLFKNIEQIQRQLQEQDKSKNKKKGKKQSKGTNEARAPLRQNEIYMKSNVAQMQKEELKELMQKKYRKQDLYGYNPENPYESISKPISTDDEIDENLEEEMEKLLRSYPQVQKALEKNNLDFKSQTKKRRAQFEQFVNKKNDMDGQNQQASKDQFQDVEQVFGNEARAAGDLSLKKSVQFQRKYKNLQKKVGQSQFQFQQDLISKEELQAIKQMKSQEYNDNLNKIQYFEKPKKGDKPNYQKKRNQKPASNYFKNKKSK